MSWVELIAERKIREAQEEGAFDALPGRGRPLDLDADRHIPAGQRVLYRLLKEAGYVPDWIELDREIRRRLPELEERQARFEARWRERAAAEQVESLDAWRDRFLLAFARELCGLNALIDRYNLVVPIFTRQRVRLDAAARLAGLESACPRLGGDEAPRPWTDLVAERRGPLQLGNRIPPRRAGTAG